MADKNGYISKGRKNKSRKPMRRLRAMIRRSFGSSALGYSSLTQNLSFLFFLTFLGILYIGNRHMAERNVRRQEALDKELIELEWYYESSKDELARKSRQSEVARLVEDIGLQELTDPPHIIYTDK